MSVKLGRHALGSMAYSARPADPSIPDSEEVTCQVRT